MNQFVKSHGLGNDYFVLDESAVSFELTPEIIKLLCHRNYGIGSDGILLLVPSNKADFGLRILNPDGSEAEKSGNGLRIFCKFIYDYGFIDRKEFTVETKGGIVSAKIIGTENGKAKLIEVDMGKAIFNSEMIPVKFKNEELKKLNGKFYKLTEKLYKLTGISVYLTMTILQDGTC